MSTPPTDKGTTPDVVERQGYTETGSGPESDTTSFDKQTPLGAMRTVEDVLEAHLEKPIVGLHDTSSMPTLSRDALTRREGAPAEKESGVARIAMLVALGVLIVAGLGVAGVVLANKTDATPRTVDGVPIEQPDEGPETVDGVEVRKGIGGKPKAK